MTTIYLQGGLGNQLFQVAAGYAHSRRTKTPLHVKCISAAHGTHWHSYLRWTTQGISAGLRWNEPHFHYGPISSEARQLLGYFQSSRYFADYSEEIRELLHPGSVVDEYVKSKYGHLLNGTYAVIHIRRGDYFKDAKAQAYHGVLTEDYYRKAVAQMRAFNPGLKLLVFSDNLPWCRGLDFLSEAIFVEEPDASIALHLMSQFQHYILSNSSFSWWAAYLGKKAVYVIAPDRWFGPTGPPDYEDIYERTWDRLAIA